MFHFNHYSVYFISRKLKAQSINFFKGFTELQSSSLKKKIKLQERPERQRNWTFGHREHIYSWSRQQARGWESKLKRIGPWASGGAVSCLRESEHSKVGGCSEKGREWGGQMRNGVFLRERTFKGCICHLCQRITRIRIQKGGNWEQGSAELLWNDRSRRQRAGDSLLGKERPGEGKEWASPRLTITIPRKTQSKSKILTCQRKSFLYNTHLQ